MKITIVIPAFNEEGQIRNFLSEIKKVKFPIIFIDDGSSDNTLNILKDFQERSNIQILAHKINLGKGAALKTGCDEAFNRGAEAVIIMDSDGQHLISDMPKFVSAISSKKYDVVFGSRNLNFGIPLVRFIGNKLASALVSFLFGIYISDLVCGYRAFTEEAFHKINWQSLGYGVETEMVVRVGKNKLRHCEVPVETIYYDKFKGVTILDAFGILLNVIKWKFNL